MPGRRRRPVRDVATGSDVARHAPARAVRSNRRRQSNDHCEQFDQCDSNHQHRDCDRIVIEPMPIRDTPPWSSNLTTYAPTYAHDIRTHGSDPIAVGSMLFLRIELLDERSDTRGNGSRERVVVGPQAVPKRQPDASIANEGRPISRGSVHQRLVGGMRCRCARERGNRLLPFRRLGLIGTKFARAVAKRMLNHVPAEPGVEAVGCPNRGVETVLYRRRGR